MTDQNKQIPATWWTPTGWERASGPPIWVELQDNSDGWDEGDLRSRFGYGVVFDHSSTYRAGAPEIWANSKYGHYIRIWDGEAVISEFFVHRQHVDAFMATEYLRLLAHGDQERQAESLQLISKALIAFVRHGHGVGTISASGDYTKEEAEERDEIRREMKAAAKQNRTKDSGP